MATGDPTGEDLCSGTTDGDTLAADPSFTEREIDLGAGTELTSGVKYAIVVRCTNDLYSLGWNYSYPNNSYANGDIRNSSDSGESWLSTYSDYDLWFKTKADGVEKEDGSFSGSERLAVSSTAWYAETFTASSTYTITSVILKLNKLGGRLPGTVTVSIRATVGVPGKPTNPSPAHEATSITLDQTPLSWDASDPAADTYDVYFRLQGADWTELSSAQVAVEIALAFGSLGYFGTYEWRVDATNEYGTTTGDTWNFVTIGYDPPLPSGVTLDEDGNPTGTATGLNNMVTIKKLVAAARNKIFYEA